MSYRRQTIVPDYTPENGKWYLVEDMGNGCTRSWPPSLLKGGMMQPFDSEQCAREFRDVYFDAMGYR